MRAGREQPGQARMALDEVPAVSRSPACSPIVTAPSAARLTIAAERSVNPSPGSVTASSTGSIAELGHRGRRPARSPAVRRHPRVPLGSPSHRRAPGPGAPTGAAARQVTCHVAPAAPRCVAERMRRAAMRGATMRNGPAGPVRVCSCSPRPPCSRAAAAASAGAAADRPAAACDAAGVDGHGVRGARPRRRAAHRRPRVRPRGPGRHPAGVPDLPRRGPRGDRPGPHRDRGGRARSRPRRRRDRRAGPRRRRRPACGPRRGPRPGAADRHGQCRRVRPRARRRDPGGGRAAQRRRGRRDDQPRPDARGGLRGVAVVRAAAALRQAQHRPPRPHCRAPAPANS